jgi:transcriptional regulator with XRE-family HTH domain
MYVVHSCATVARVLALTERGLSDYEVARRTGVSRSTVQSWRRFGVPEIRRQEALSRPLDERAFSYLLGIYLGDGWVGRTGRSWNLQVVLDLSYPDIVREVAGAIAQVSEARVRTLMRTKKSSVVIQSSGKDWRNLFPQHGPGKKHERKIELVDWQLEITRVHTRKFIRGLIHSDGSRCINRFSVRLPSGRIGRYAYPRYFFTNYSADIRAIFCEHCDLLGIRWSQSNPRNISISHRDSVALLDSFVGPKS